MTSLCGFINDTRGDMVDRGKAESKEECQGRRNQKNGRSQIT